MPVPSLILRACLCLLLAGALGVSATRARAQPRDATLQIATWNLEWLMTPQTHAALRLHCVPEGESGASVRSIPCDVARQRSRGREDFDKLAEYATRLDADVIAIQEVDGPEAAKLVFRDHDFCFTARRAVQNTGFAIRRGRGIRFRCDGDFEPLALHHSHLRAGAQLTLFAGSADELHLLGVHLKSGCAGQRLDQPLQACELLSQQVAPLKTWVDARARAGQRFMLLGDFNRRLAQERGRPRDGSGRLVRMWPALDQPDVTGADLNAITQGRAYIKCRITERHGAYIDHIIAGERAADRWLTESFRRVGYAPVDAARWMLSDHCPMSIRYRLVGSDGRGG